MHKYMCMMRLNTNLYRHLYNYLYRSIYNYPYSNLYNTLYKLLYVLLYEMLYRLLYGKSVSAMTHVLVSRRRTSPPWSPSCPSAPGP